MSERLTEEEFGREIGQLLFVAQDGWEIGGHEWEGLQKTHDALLADRAALVKRVEELEGALRPFAEEGIRLAKSDRKWHLTATTNVGHFQDAAQALGEPQQKGAGE